MTELELGFTIFCMVVVIVGLIGIFTA